MSYFCTMVDKNDKSGIIYSDSLLFLLVVSLFLLIHNGPLNKSSERNENSISTQISISKNCADISPAIRLQVFHKNLCLNSNIFKLLSYTKMASIVDKKSDHKIVLLQNKRNKSDNPTVCIFRHYLFPFEKEEVPNLS